MHNLARALAGALAVTIAASPAFANVTIQYDRTTGTFQPWFATVHTGETVTWTGLARDTQIARILRPPNATPRPAVCDGHNYTRAFDGSTNDFTGPTRRGVSGIWALGPEGGKVSPIEAPSTDPANPNPAAHTCAALNDLLAPIQYHDDSSQPTVITRERVFRYSVLEALSGEPLAGVQAYTYGTVDGLPGTATPGADGQQHELCEASTWDCTPGRSPMGSDVNPRLLGCTKIDVDPADASTIPPGTYANGLLKSTYDDPDVTGVVLRFNWSDLQRAVGGVITDRWTDLDRELARAVSTGKLVTLDVRAGMYGTPPWIFTDYETAVTSPSAYATPYLRQVTPRWFVDHYDEDPPGYGCGSPVKIGSPGDPAYRALYTDFIRRLAAHVASDSRWFDAIAHVKVSGANLQTSEAELPHHCDDQYVNTVDHHANVKAGTYQKPGDGVLDAFKDLDGSGAPRTTECTCNTQEWWNQDHYTPDFLYDYYAAVEHEIVTDFFGKKSLGYQIIQDGFPRVDAQLDADGVDADGDGYGDDGSYWGDHLYRETLVDHAGVLDNQGLVDELTCSAPTTASYPPTGAVGPHLWWDTATGDTDYCSSDQAALSGGASYAEIVVDPIRTSPDPARNGLAYANDGDGVRFPGPHDQTNEVMREAGNGRFASATLDAFDPASGRLFVPQHSGIQPMSSERVALGYSTVAGAACGQQRVPDGAALPSAQFPIGPSQTITQYWEPGGAGCPNWWATTQGTKVEHFPSIPLDTPPQVTGFQTTNKVRNVAMVESALFNLVYNTNGVFIELYEDSLWHIRVAKGGGPLQDRLTALSQPGGACAGVAPGTGLCYTKTLAQWSEELHARRAALATLTQDYGGQHYPALEDPFASSYSFTFGAPAAGGESFGYVNTAHCNEALVTTSNPRAGGPGALGVIVLMP